MEASESTRRRVDRAALVQAIVAGLTIAAAAAALHAVLDRRVDDLGDSGWVLLPFALLIVAYLTAGSVAQRRASAVGVADTPLTLGSLAGIGVFVCWLPVRVLIWLVREEDRGLVRGRDGALRPGQLFGGLVIAAAFGIAGALVTARRGRRVRGGPASST
jgi:uncharacterized membrane protein YhaH (DUF805 family)